MITSNGQTIAHIAQAMHFVSIDEHDVVLRSRQIAPVGQTCWQGAGSQWRHLLGKAVPDRAPASTWIRLRGTGTSNGAIAGSREEECSVAQANSH